MLSNEIGVSGGGDSRGFFKPQLDSNIGIIKIRNFSFIKIKVIKNFL